MPTAELQSRFRLTPGHCLLALLAVEFLLFLSQWFRWLPKGWPVLIAVAAVGVVMLGMLVWLAAALIFRWRFQFSIRSLLVMAVVVAVPCSWFSAELRTARQIELISASDCIVFGDDITDDEGQLDPTRIESPTGPCRFPSGLAYSLPAMLGRDFFHNARTIVHVKNDLPDGRNYFAKYRKREVAYSVLLAVKKLPDLRSLDLSQMPLDDSDLEHLTPLNGLRHLDLTDTKVTAEGVAKLQQALPNCKITR